MANGFAARLMSVTIGGETFEVNGELICPERVSVDDGSQTILIGREGGYVMTGTVRVIPGAGALLSRIALREYLDVRPIRKERRAQWKREQGLGRFR